MNFNVGRTVFFCIDFINNVKFVIWAEPLDTHGVFTMKQVLQQHLYSSLE